MKKTILGIIVTTTIAFIASGCGYSSKENEAMGQAKRIIKHTPLVCFDYIELDISLGILRNGVGSMSTQDIYVNLTDKTDIELAKKAVEDGSLVKVTYDAQRVYFCTLGRWVTKLEIVNP